MKKMFIAIIVVVFIIGIGYYLYRDYKANQELENPRFYSGNGRLEAKEFYVSAKLAGRIEKIFVKEGDLVRKGDKLVQMDTSTLKAQRDSVKAQIAVKKSTLEMAKATVQLKQSSLNGAKKEYDRQKTLLSSKATSRKNYDDAHTKYQNALAELQHAQANVGVAEGEIAQQTAELQRIEVDINDSLLKASYDGRIEYMLAHEGEVISAGGRVLNAVDLTDVYMVFFLPTKIAGRVRMGSEVRLLFDAMPEYSVVAKITFVDPIAQFTPKSVETKIEREKLMFRLKASLNASELRQYIEFVKTGLPGVAWIKLEPKADWKEVSGLPGIYEEVENASKEKR